MLPTPDGPASPPQLTSSTIESLRELLMWADQAQQNQHDAIASRIHDELGSSLTALSMRLAIVARQCPPDPKLAVQWQKANLQLSAIADAVRELQLALRPVAFGSIGFNASMREYLQRFQHRTGLTCQLQSSGDEPALMPERSALLFRIVQEALENAARHARANTLQLVVLSEADVCCISVIDDGVGFNPAAISTTPTHGLRLMAERAITLRAHLTITSEPGRGCCITLIIPFKS